jgi:hypothetical protein
MMGMGQGIDAKVRFVWSTNGKAGHVQTTVFPKGSTMSLDLKDRSI